MHIELTDIQVSQNGFIIVDDIKYTFNIIDKSIIWDLIPVGNLLEIEKSILLKEDWRIIWFRHIQSNFGPNI